MDDADIVRDISVQHLILAREGRTDESWQTATNRLYHLRGVGYRYVVAPDVEFPTSSKPPWAVYLRVTGWNTGPCRVLFGVHYKSPRGPWERLDERVMDRAIPLPEVGAETHETVLQLPFLRLGGEGLHAITVHFWYDGIELDADPLGESADAEEPAELFRTPDWVYRAVDYFWIGRAQ